MINKNFTLVLADDDLDDQELFREALKAEGHDIRLKSIYNGQQLLDYLLKSGNFKNNKDEMPDILIIDLNMPVMDGFTVLKEIKSNPLLQNIPAFILSTTRSEYDEKRALELGVRGYYAKTITMTGLQGVINKILGEIVVTKE